MSKGILYFAIGENYLKMAEKSATILKAAGFDIAVITDMKPTNGIFDHVIKKDAIDVRHSMRVIDGIKMPWRNGNRSIVYDVSPFDRTLVLDADFFCDPADAGLALDCKHPIMVADQVISPVHPLHTNELTLWERGIPLKWATAFVFDHANPYASWFFTTCSYIEQNYDHFATIYGCNNGLYRNDYVFSIACHMLKDTYIVHPLPFTYGFADQSVSIKELEISDFRSTLSCNDVNTLFYGSIHCLNKKSFMECKVI